MTVKQIISDLKHCGITIETIEGKIRLHGTEDVLNQNTIRLVKTHKPEIISYMSQANIQKINFPMNGQDLIEFKRLAEASVQFDFPEENPVIPSTF